MKTITLKVTIQVPDDYTLDKPQWLLEDCTSCRQSECEIISVTHDDSN